MVDRLENPGRSENTSSREALVGVQNTSRREHSQKNGACGSMGLEIDP